MSGITSSREERLQGFDIESPKVSCLMVTADRPALCRRAILSYRNQTYANKELIVLDNGEHSIRHLLSELPAEEWTYLRVPKSRGLFVGGLRNVALEAASGDFVIPQWDDDDWSHPERITRQVETLMEGYEACMLTGTLMHVDGAPYFDHPFIGILPGGVPPTIMHRRDADIRYPDLRRTSDSAYVAEWRSRTYVQLPRTESYLYLRYFHGDNLWEMEHFLRRMRNTPHDLLAYGWYKFIRRDLFSHPRFRIGRKGERAFERYLEDSRALNLFE